MVAAQKTEDAPTVYLVSETPDTLDKPVLDFSKMSYTDGRDMNNLNVTIHQKNKALADAQNAESFEDLIDQLEALTKEQKLHIVEQGQENKILAIRIRRLESRIENWQDSPADIKALAKEVNELLDKQESYILVGVTYIPQAWLIKGAPLAKGIDWADHANLKYLRADKFQPLARIKREAMNDSPN